MPSTEVWAWARAQWGQAALGDERRQRRAVAVGAALAQASARSLPQQMASPAATQAAFRLMNGTPVTHWALSEAHRVATRQAARAQGQAPVLFVQDGSCLDFTHRTSLEGLAPHRRRSGPGLLSAVLPRRPGQTGGSPCSDQGSP